MSLIIFTTFLSVLLLVGIVLLFFSVKKKSILGILISIILIAPLFFFCLINAIDELSISKEDIVSDLKHVKVELKENFEIRLNTVKGMPDRIQETEIEVSESDRSRVIEIIRTASNFKSYTTADEIPANTLNAHIEVSNTIFNMKYPEFYVREILKPVDHIPTRIRITVDDQSNILTYQRIED